MEKNLRSFWLHAALQLAIWEMVLLALAGLLFWQVGWLHQYRFSDALFLVGLLQLILGGAALMGSPVDEIGTPWLRMWSRTANPPQMSGQILADFAQKESFFVRLTASGLLTMLLSVVLSLFG